MTDKPKLMTADPYIAEIATIYARAWLEWMALQIQIASGGMETALNPPGEPGSYARGYYNGMLDSAVQVRAAAKEIK